MENCIPATPTFLRKHTSRFSRQLGAKRHVSDESIRDTLMDLASYCVMELVEMEGYESDG